jgi:branched-chain amino acid transport system ATP-binding protein
MLSVTGLTMRFGGLKAIDDLSFEARAGEITAVIGPNGAGKTTAFNCITGFYKPSEGGIVLTHASGERFPLDRMPGHRIASRARVARTFQNIRLFAGMTVLENLLVAQHNVLMGASGYSLLALLGASRYRAVLNTGLEKARHWLDRIALIERANDLAGALPYGAQRRLEIARAMCIDPVLLCLDEPAAGLNPRETDALNALLLGIRADGCSLLLIEHDMGVVMRISDRVVVLDHGKKIADGSPMSVRADAAVVAAYLGEGDDDEESA